MGMLMMEADMSWQLLPPALTNDEWNILGGFELFLGYRESESSQIKVAKFEENIAEGKMDPDILSALNLLKASFQSTFINSRFITAQSRHCLQREESRTRCELLQSK